MLYWHFTRIATAICEEHVCNKPGGREVLPCKHHSSQSCLCSSGGTGCFHSQVCHRYGKQAAHASQLKSCRLKRARPAAAATVKMLFGNHLLRELYKEWKIHGRDAGLVLLHFLEVTNTKKKKLLSQNKAFLPLQRHISRQGRLALYSWPSNVLLTVVSKDLFSSGLSKKNTTPNQCGWKAMPKPCSSAAKQRALSWSHQGCVRRATFLSSSAYSEHTWLLNTEHTLLPFTYVSSPLTSTFDFSRVVRKLYKHLQFCDSHGICFLLLPELFQPYSFH